MARAKRKQSHSIHHATKHHVRHGHGKKNGGHELRDEAEEMMSAGREQIGRAQKSAQSAFAAFDVFNGPMARIMDHNWSLFQKTIQAMQEESLRFFNTRLEHTSQIVESSRDFEGVSGLMQLQQEWMLDLARDYSEQATRLAHRIRDLAVDSTERFAEASAEALEQGEAELEGEEDEERRAAA